MTELPGGWAEGALRQLGIWCGGGTPSKRVASYWVGDIPWVSPKDMKVERIKDTVDHISAEAVEESSTNLVSAGSILVVTRSGILSHSLPVAVTDREVALNQDLKALFPDDGIVAEYVAWALRSASRAILRDCSKAGTTVANIDTARLLDFRIPLAPLNEQRRIVAAIEEQLSRLDAADASLVAARRRLRAILRPVRERAIESGPERTLGDLLNGIEAGKSFKCHSRAADPDEWGVVKVSAMTWGAFNERENKAVISEERVDARWEINPGDLLLSRANTTDYVGATVLVGECRRRLLLSDKSMRLLVADGVYRPWLLHALSAPGVRAQMSAVATGTSDSMRNISQAKVNSIRLRVPPLEEQRRIVAEVEERLSVIDAMRASISNAQRRSAALRASILERAFRGELVPQDPSDEPASVLLDRIRTTRAASTPAKSRGTSGKTAK